MQLASLRLLNITKAKVKAAHQADLAAFHAESFLPGEFRLDSCQRVLWLCTEESLKAALCGRAVPSFVEVFAGTSAYQFLLRVATGLESQLVGETDIFGQLKEAWKKFEAATPATPLKSWIQRAFEDTKEIRSAHLQSQGGATYGSLVRRMIRDHLERAEAPEAGPVLLVGAGALAAAVAPYLSDYETHLTNRSQDKLETLKQELSHASGAGVSIVSPGEMEALAWQQAAVVVVCIPMDSTEDSERISRLRGDALVIHLGGMRHQAGEWTEVPGFRCLDDVFGLQKSQNSVRSLRCAHAIKACEDRAKLRSLGASLAIPHGWEDLAVFA
ncbi:MAG: hypothetical protein NDJ90_08305 [Oligoflexia bacterium]|nr:hypothetical protein [Oligoflexia bacterium]